MVPETLRKFAKTSRSESLFYLRGGSPPSLLPPVERPAGPEIFTNFVEPGPLLDMGRPLQEIEIYGLQDRRASATNSLGWVVRYRLDGRERSKAFRTRSEADRYRGQLLRAVEDGHRFDKVTGEPEKWKAPLGDLHVHEWARRWLAEQWQEWQPRTRTSALQALARFTALAVVDEFKPPAGLRAYLLDALRPDFRCDEQQL